MYSVIMTGQDTLHIVQLDDDTADPAVKNENVGTAAQNGQRDMQGPCRTNGQRQLLYGTGQDENIRGTADGKGRMIAHRFINKNTV